MFAVICKFSLTTEPSAASSQFYGLVATLLLHLVINFQDVNKLVATYMFWAVQWFVRCHILKETHLQKVLLLPKIYTDLSENLYRVSLFS